MTTQELKTFVESIIDETLDQDLFINLLNIEKDILLGDRDWEVMKKTDTSQTANTSDTYLTMKSLPSDFGSPLSQLNVGVDDIYKPIQYNDRFAFRNRKGFFYIDYANNQFAIIGAPGSAQTIYLPYIFKATEVSALTDDLDTASIFPLLRNGQKLLGIRIAAYYTGGIDYDDIYARMSPQHQVMARRIEKQLEDWNTKLVLSSMDYSAGEYNNANGSLVIGDL